MKKVIRDGKVAVIYSPGFGAGWSTWDAPAELIFDPELVEMIERRAPFEEIKAVLNTRGYDFYMGAAYDLAIEWLDEGTQFRISEYDGSEEIVLKETDNWMKA